VDLCYLIIILDLPIELGRTSTEEVHCGSYSRLTTVELEVLHRRTNREEQEDTPQHVMLIHCLPNRTTLVLDKIVLVHGIDLGGLVFRSEVRHKAD